jgi:hypothetical protein
MMKVLFIGNSYTGCNDLPGMLRGLAGPAGHILFTQTAADWGKSLDWHTRQPKTLDAMTSDHWDYVVLQDHSLSAIDSPTRFREAVLELNRLIRSVNATPVLFVTWARQHKPEMQDPITATYTRAAEEIDAILAPVGPAWRRALAARPQLILHTDDRSHPTKLGTYLAACVFYATLYEESPVGLPHRLDPDGPAAAKIDRDVATFLQTTAWQSVMPLRSITPPTNQQALAAKLNDFNGET